MSISIPQRIAAVAIDRETNGRTKEFALVCKYLMLERSSPVQAERLAIADCAPDRVVAAIGKAAQDPMTMGTLGTTLSPFQLLAQSFLSSLSSATAFDAMLSSMLVLPLRTRILSVTNTMTGTTLAELDIKRVTRLSLTASDLDISKAAAVTAITREVLEGGGDGGLRYLERELRAAVALATDSQFLTLITTGATSIPSSGGNANGARLDLRALLQQITYGDESRLFLITTPDIAAAWCVLGDSTGAQVFANAIYNGGTIGGVRIVASDSCPAQQIILADASGIAANSEGLRLDDTEVATIQMDTAPDSPPTASTNVINLWQNNMVGVKVERWFGAKVVRSNAVALITGANYTGGSPA